MDSPDAVMLNLYWILHVYTIKSLILVDAKDKAIFYYNTR